jgi:transposase
MEVILGVDVSSQKLDACLQSPKHAKPMFKTVAYTNEGCKKLLTWAARHKVTRCAMEATGGYELGIARRIMQTGIKLYIANPNRIRHFAKGDGILAKTDKIDAFVIAEFARKSNLPAAFEASPLQIEFKQLIARRIELKKNLQVEKCRMRLAEGAILQSHENLIAAIDNEIEQVDRLIAALETQHPDIAQKVQVLCQQKGVGKVTAQALIALIPELGHIDRRRIASLIGLAPIANESGKMKGKRFISGGRCEARRCLYMPAWVATQYDPEFGAFYQRLIENGKKPKVAITAVMRKLLVRLNAKMRIHLMESLQNT